MKWILGGSIILLGFSFNLALAQVRVEAIVPGVCGNGVREVLEQCDDPDLGGLSCLSLGYESGDLTCSAECTLVTTACIPFPPPPAPPVSSVEHFMSGSRPAILILLPFHPAFPVTFTPTRPVTVSIPTSTTVIPEIGQPVTPIEINLPTPASSSTAWGPIAQNWFALVVLILLVICAAIIVWILIKLLT